MSSLKDWTKEKLEYQKISSIKSFNIVILEILGKHWIKEELKEMF